MGTRSFPVTPCSFCSCRSCWFLQSLSLLMMLSLDEGVLSGTWRRHLVVQEDDIALFMLRLLWMFQNSGQGRFLLGSSRWYNWSLCHLQLFLLLLWFLNNHIDRHRLWPLTTICSMLRVWFPWRIPVTLSFVHVRRGDDTRWEKVGLVDLVQLLVWLFYRLLLLRRILLLERLRRWQVTVTITTTAILAVPHHDFAALLSGRYLLVDLSHTLLADLPEVSARVVLLAIVAHNRDSIRQDGSHCILTNLLSRYLALSLSFRDFSDKLLRRRIRAVVVRRLNILRSERLLLGFVYSLKLAVSLSLLNLHTFGIWRSWDTSLVRHYCHWRRCDIRHGLLIEITVNRTSSRVNYFFTEEPLRLWMVRICHGLVLLMMYRY